MKRTSFTRQRQGAAEALAITPAWLLVRHVRPEAILEGAWSAKIRVRSDWDVRVGDVLKEEDGRLFVVQQMAPEQATMLLLCSEVKGLIPDDFSSQVLNVWWTDNLGGRWEIGRASCRERV